MKVGQPTISVFFEEPKQIQSRLIFSAFTNFEYALQGIDPDAADENDENDVEDVDGDTEEAELM